MYAVGMATKKKSANPVGRPQEASEKMEPHTVYLWPSMAKKLKAHGDGNIGRGIRKALADFKGWKSK